MTKDTVLGLLVLSDKYNVSDLKESCSAYMKRHLVGPADWCRAVVWYQYALACSSSSLQQACLDYIVLNADVVVQSGHWVCLDAENLIVILRRSDLVIESEYAVLKVNSLKKNFAVSEISCKFYVVQCFGLIFLRFSYYASVDFGVLWC